MTLLVRRSLLLLGLAALRARPLQMRLSRTQDGKFLKRLRHAPTTHSVDRILGEIRRSPATVDQQQKHFEAAIVTASHVGTAKDPLRLLTAMRRELGRPPRGPSPTRRSSAPAPGAANGRRPCAS